MMTVTFGLSLSAKALPRLLRNSPGIYRQIQLLAAQSIWRYEPLSAEAVIKQVWNIVIVHRETENVGIFVIILTRWHTDHQGIVYADILMRVENISWNDHQAALMFRAVNLVDHMVSRRLRTIIIEHNLNSTLADEYSIIVQMVDVPTLDLARTDR